MEQKTRGENIGKPCIFSTTIKFKKKFVINIRGIKNRKYAKIIKYFCIEKPL